MDELEGIALEAAVRPRATTLGQKRAVRNTSQRGIEASNPSSSAFQPAGCAGLSARRSAPFSTLRPSLVSMAASPVPVSRPAAYEQPLPAAVRFDARGKDSGRLAER